MLIVKSGIVGSTPNFLLAIKLHKHSQINVAIRSATCPFRHHKSDGTSNIIFIFIQYISHLLAHHQLTNMRVGMHMEWTYNIYRTHIHLFKKWFIKIKLSRTLSSHRVCVYIVCQRNEPQNHSAGRIQSSNHQKFHAFKIRPYWCHLN